jgi:hypothetical protein
MRRAFDEQHALRLPQFVHSELLASIQQTVRTASFYTRNHDGIAREACMAANPTLAMLALIMNDPALFDFIHRISGCRSIRYFGGRVYAFASRADHYDRWHSDAIDARRVGVSVNLSEHEFSGGIFELRHADGDAVQWAAANTGPGDALLFRISDDLVHRVTPVVGPVSRIAYAGWFQDGPDLLTVLKNPGFQHDGAANSMQYTDPFART